MFDGFEHRRVRTDDADIAVVVGGSGPPVLLLHGYPQTLAMWHEVAVALAADATVVAADLRGYGDSTVTAAATAGSAYSFRAMARDQVEVMGRLGFDRFSVVGHDRGARTAHRMALDQPERVDRVALLDILPTRHVLATVDRRLASRYYHWFFLSQPSDLPEQLINGSPMVYLHRTLAGLGTGLDAFHPAALAEYERCFDSATVHAICEDYRAAMTVDGEHDEADAGRRLPMPALVLWGSRGVVGAWDDPLAVWREYAEDVRGVAIDAGHFLVEERPADVLAQLRAFL